MKNPIDYLKEIFIKVYSPKNKNISPNNKLVGAQFYDPPSYAKGLEVLSVKKKHPQ